MSPCLNAALDYLARGWSAIPLCAPDHTHDQLPPWHLQKCHSPGKVPTCQWETYQTKLPTDKVLRVLFARYPRPNVGVCLGPVSGLVGLDVDGESGADLLEQLIGSDECKTIAFRTGNGLRLLFKHPDGPALPNRSIKDNQGHEALKILSQGTQTVMPPSIHPSGRAYDWVEECLPDQLQPAECPAWLIDLARRGQVAPAAPASVPASPTTPEPPTAGLSIQERARRYLARMGPCHPEREHPQDASSHHLKAATALVVGYGLSEDEALPLIQEWHPWPEKEIRRKCKEALRACNKPKGYLLMQATDRPHANGRHADLPPLPPPTRPRKPLKPGMDAATLAATEFPPIRWAVEGIIPEGASILAGRPKIGKSWLILNIALAIASGGTALGRIHVEPGDVLYLALEDGPRRLQRRLKKLLDAQHCAAPRNLFFYTDWPRHNEGGLDHLHDWLTVHKDARLVLVDTLAKVRDRRRVDGGLYDEDYQAIEGYARLGAEHHTAIDVVTHCRKPKGSQVDDPLDEVLSTTGLTGAADAVQVLKRLRYGTEGTLSVTGRDITEERDIPLLWHPPYCLWEMRDEVPLTDMEAQLSADQRAILRTIRQAGRPLKVLEISGQIHKDYEAVAKMLQRMAGVYGLLKKTKRGEYAIPGETPEAEPMSKCPNVSNSDEEPNPFLT
jgi:hypothetical protein